MKQHLKIANPNSRKQKILATVVFGVAIIGTFLIVLSQAATPYSNPYSCSTHPTLSTSTGSSQPTCTKYLQTVLNGSISAGLTVDGVFGSATKTAVQKFQFTYKISNSGCNTTSYTSCDGIVGSATWTKVDSENARLKQAAATPTGTLACGASTSTTTVQSFSFSNAGTNGAVLLRGSTQIASYSGASGSGSHTDTGLAAATSYTYTLKSGSTILKSVTCKTGAKPTGSLSCGAVTTSSIVVNVSYSNGDGATGLYRGTTLLVSYAKGAATTSRTDSGLAANTSYAYSLKSGSTLLASVSCKTAAPTATTPPPTTTTPPPSGGTTDPEPDPGDPIVVDEGSPLDPSFTDDSSEDSGIDVSSSGSSNESGDVVDGVTLDGSSDESSDSSSDTTYDDTSSDSSDSSTSSGTKSPAAKSASTLKAVLSALGVIALMVIGFFGWLIIRSRRLDAEQSYDYSTYDYGTVATTPVVDTGLPAPQAPTDAAYSAAPFPSPAPVVDNSKLETIINDTFYPGQVQPASSPQPKVDEPLDMFDLANQYPNSFGNSHNVIGSAPVQPAHPDDLIPLPPMPEPTPPAEPVQSAMDSGVLQPLDSQEPPEPTVPITNETEIKDEPLVPSEPSSVISPSGDLNIKH